MNGVTKPSRCNMQLHLRVRINLRFNVMIHHIPRFDMMGAGTPDNAYGVRDFKARFGGTEVEHGRFKHISRPLLYKLGEWGVKLLKMR